MWRIILFFDLLWGKIYALNGKYHFAEYRNIISNENHHLPRRVVARGRMQFVTVLVPKSFGCLH